VVSCCGAQLTALVGPAGGNPAFGPSRHMEACGRAGATNVPATSFHLDPQFLDDRPPFAGIGFHQRAERLRCLLASWENLVPEFD
jgi:hypothetical protein